MPIFFYKRVEYTYTKGLFNLAQLIEQGHRVPAALWTTSLVTLAHLQNAPAHEQITGIYEM